MHRATGVARCMASLLVSLPESTAVSGSADSHQPALAPEAGLWYNSPGRQDRQMAEWLRSVKWRRQAGWVLGTALLALATVIRTAGIPDPFQHASPAGGVCL